MSYPLPSAPAPEPAHSRFIPGVLVGALTVLVVAALVAGLLLGTGALGSAGSDRELSLPDRIGPLTSQATHQKILEENPEQAASAEKLGEQTGANWSEAYDGASATAALYSNDELTDHMLVVAVAAHSPGLAAPGYDLERLQVALPPTEVRTYGEVECLLRNQPVAVGEVDEDMTFVEHCQRSSDDLTVRILHAGGEHANDPETVAAYVDEAFESLA